MMLDLEDMTIHAANWRAAQATGSTAVMTARAQQPCVVTEIFCSCSPLESGRGIGSLESDDGKAQSLPAELLRSSCSASAFEQDAQALRLQKFYDAHGLRGADMTGLHRVVATCPYHVNNRHKALPAELLCPFCPCTCCTCDDTAIVCAQTQ